jgi:hypothetical protein
MSTRAQRAANRRNAQASTGPVTDAGKEASSQNARTHGFSSAQFTLQPGEDPNDFDQLIDRIRLEMKPATEHEGFLVALMAQARWKRGRIQAHEMALLDKLLEGEPVETKLALMMRYAADAERAYYRAHREFTQSRNQSHKQQQAAFNDIVAAALVPLPGETRLASPQSFNSASFRKAVNSASLPALST